MGMEIGAVLLTIRKKKRIRQGSVCHGICGISTYSQYENGERVPDILSLRMLFERLGYTPKGLNVYVSEDSLRFWRWKRDLNVLLIHEKYKELAMHLSKMPVSNSALNQHLIQQCIYYVNGIIAEKVTCDLEQAQGCYEKALMETCPAILSAERIEGCIGASELFLYLLYLRLVMETRRMNQCQLLSCLGKVISYIEQGDMDDSEKVFIYPPAVYLWSRCCDGDNRKKHTELKKGLDLLIKYKSTYYALELVEMLAALEDSPVPDRYRKIYGMIFCMYEELGIGRNGLWYQLRPDEMMVEDVGQYLRKARKKKQFSQEDACDGICAVESYSKIENGRHPSRNHYQALAEKIDVEERYYVDQLNTGNIEALMLRSRINGAMNERKYQEAEVLLATLEDTLGAEAENNRSFIELVRGRLDYCQDRISIQDYHTELLRILNRTLDLDEIGKNTHTYTYLETKAINNIAFAEYKMDHLEKARDILERMLYDLQQECEGGEDQFRFHETKLAKLNLGKALTDMEQYGDAKTLYLENIIETLGRNDSFQIAELLSELAYVYIVEDQGNVMAAKRYLSYAIAIADLYEEREMMTFLVNYYKEQFGGAAY